MAFIEGIAAILGDPDAQVECLPALFVLLLASAGARAACPIDVTHSGRREHYLVQPRQHPVGDRRSRRMSRRHRDHARAPVHRRLLRS
jgi:hypothetical protein